MIQEILSLDSHTTEPTKPLKGGGPRMVSEVNEEASYGEPDDDEEEGSSRDNFYGPEAASEYQDMI